MKAYLKQLFFPEEACLFCGNPVEFIENQKLPDTCSTCDAQLEMIEGLFCERCHKPVAEFQPVTATKRQTLCEDCLAISPPYLTQNRSALVYNDFIKERLAMYKYRGKESLAVVFSYLLKIAYDRYFERTKMDLLTYIPLHPKRLAERGFNQAEQLAIQVHQLTGIPLSPLLIRVKDTTKQSKTGKQERKIQLEGAFALDGSDGQVIHGKNILIIDDIYTTGATLHEVVKVLIQAGASQVYSLTLARAINKAANLSNDNKNNI